MVYEVVCTKSYLDVGLCIDKNIHLKPRRVLSRANEFNGGNGEYGGVEKQDWVNTGVFLSKDEWKNVSYNKNTEQIFNELGIEKKNYSNRQTEVYSDDPIDYVRKALAIETLAYHDKNYLNNSLASSNARISEEIQALLTKAIFIFEEGLDDGESDNERATD